jgi:hypothetical protein
LATNGINLINKDDAWGILPGLSEDVSDTGSSYTDEHLDEFRTTDGDEWNSGFSRNGLGQKGLTGTGGSIKDDTTGDAASVLGVCFGLLQEINNFGEFELGTVTSGNVIETDTGVGNHLDFSLGLSESSHSTHTGGSTSRHAAAASLASTAEEE